MPTKPHALKGRKKSLEHKRKIREALKGRHLLKGLPLAKELERRRKISESTKGRPKSDDVKKKISDAQKGRPKSLRQRKKVSEGLKRFFANGGKIWNKGKKYPQILGEKNVLWRGGVSEEYELLRKVHAAALYKWRKAVLEKDGHACVSCGDIENLCAHHIKCFIEYPNLRFDVSNGETLCNSCHSKRHVEIKKSSRQ